MRHTEVAVEEVVFAGHVFPQLLEGAERAGTRAAWTLVRQQVVKLVARVGVLERQLVALVRVQGAQEERLEWTPLAREQGLK